MKILNSLLTFFVKLLELKSVHPLILVGKIIFLAGMVGGLSLVLSLNYRGLPIDIKFSSAPGLVISIVSITIGIAVMLVGALMNMKAHHSEIIYLQGMPFAAPFIPKTVVGKPFSLHNPHLTVLEISDNSPEESIEDINGRCKLILEQALSKEQYSKVFFAGFARIPCIFSVATMFRGCSMDIEAIERFKSPAKWSRLKEFEVIDRPNIHLLDDLESHVSKDKEVGVAISISSAILVDELPDYISSNTKIFRLLPNESNEAFTVRSHVDEFAMEFKALIDKLSKSANTIHLFISAQTSVVFALGRMYQEGMHSKIVIHNFEPSSKSYKWAIYIDNGEIGLYTRSTKG